MAIQDFGEKIGGARKDLWGKRGLNLDDIADFNVAERDKYIKKNNIWIKPDYAKLLNEEGYSRNALYFIKTLRDSLPTAPEIRYSDSPETIKEKQDAYIAFINEFKKDIMEVKTDKDIEKMGIKYLVDKGYVQKGRYRYEYVGNSETFISQKFFKAIQADSYKIAREAKKKNFLGDELEGQKANFSILEVDGQSVRLDMNRLQNDGRLVLEQQLGAHSVRYLYPNNTELNDVELYQTGTHIVLDDHRIIFAGSKEAAEEFLTETAQNIIDSKKAITQAVNNAAKEVTKEIDKEIKRKRPLVPPTLAHIRRSGPDVRRRNAVGQDFLDQFHIRGGEFGNWVNEAERQTNMNMAFDSFKDMAKALNINDEDISLGGKLSIAFGARGFSRALAHYEPAREVINLTKMKGAGSLAHEYFHAMDDIAGKIKGNSGKFATEQKDKSSAFTELVNTMKYKEKVVSAEENKRRAYEAQVEREEKLITELHKMVPDSRLSLEKIEERDKLISTLLDQAKNSSQKININPICKFINEYSDSYEMTTHNKKWLTSRLDSIRFNIEYLSTLEFTETTAREETEFYKNAKQLDNLYAKSDKGYWASDIELAARAFACYIHDKLEEQGIKNDYLTGHAFMTGEVPSYPSKEERQAINKVFDKVIEEMKNMGIFHQREENQIAAETLDYYIVAEKTPEAIQFTVYDNRDFSEVNSGKLSPEVDIHQAIETVRGLMKQDIAEEIDYAVFEATKSAKLEELHKAAQQKALQESMNVPPIDPTSYQQMTLDDLINQAMESQKGQTEKNEKFKSDKKDRENER